MPPDDDCDLLFAADSYSGGFTNMDPDRERLYETCQRLGVGITVMRFLLAAIFCLIILLRARRLP